MKILGSDGKEAAKEEVKPRLFCPFQSALLPVPTQFGGMEVKHVSANCTAHACALFNAEKDRCGLLRD